MKTAPFPVLFTDLDGSLLDHRSYAWDEAAPALAKCREAGTPVVMASSKTRAEMEPLRIELGLDGPFIVENGGGVFFPVEAPLLRPEGSERDGAFWKVSLGVPCPALRKALDEAARELGLRVTGFHDMSVRNIAELTGLSMQQAEKAANRHFDEPFVIDASTPADPALLREAFGKRGLELSVGGRFYHVHGKADKGTALDKVVAWYKMNGFQVVSVALGDSQNDFSMLRRADYAYYLGKGSAPVEEVPRVMQAPAPGPSGWNRVILDFLNNLPVKGETKKP